jgi:molybdopterin synthase catalytic subunit
MIIVELKEEPFDPGAMLAPLNRLGGGGAASFVGLVRGDDGLVELLLEHHPDMTLPAMERLVDEAVRRWSLLGAIVLHRHGAMEPGEAIVAIGTAAAHRHAALESCAFLIDRLKTEATFWKRERFADGRTRWVEPRLSDDEAARRWGAAIAPPGPNL